jgi:selenide,water dikinase
LDDIALARAVSTMTTSNASTSIAALEADVHACTDVTGFGLLGHLAEMLSPELGATLELGKIPVLAEALQLPSEVAHTLWIESNYKYTRSRLEIRGISDQRRMSVLLDPQTNGGLLISVPEEATQRLGTQGFSLIGCVTDTVGFDVRE